MFTRMWECLLILQIISVLSLCSHVYVMQLEHSGFENDTRAFLNVRFIDGDEMIYKKLTRREKKLQHEWHRISLVARSFGEKTHVRRNDKEKSMRG